MSLIVNDNCSEDIFQESDSQDCKLRRSQRILKKHLKAPDTQDKIPPNQTNNKFTIRKQNSTAAAQIIYGIDESRGQTPDFTCLLETNHNDPSEAVLNVETLNENYSKIILGTNFEAPFDISKTKSKNITFATSMDKFSKKEINFNEKGENLTITKPETTAEELLLISTLGNAVNRTVITQKRSQSTVLALNAKHNKNSECKKTEEHKTTDEKENLDTTTQNSVPTVKQRKRKSILSNAGAPKKPTSSSDVNIDLTKVATKTSSRIFQRKQQEDKSKPPTKSATPSAKSTTVINRNQSLQGQIKTESSATKTPVFQYVPPKVMRYYNTCPAAASFPFENCTPIHKSLLPTVYPPHFKNQIAIPSSSVTRPLIQPEYVDLVTPASSSTIPISLLTPENSEIPIASPNKIDTSPTTAISPFSLRNFFETDEINDIFDLEKTVFELTELHVRALAVVLNMNSDELFQKLADITKSERDSLQKILTIAGIDSI